MSSFFSTRPTGSTSPAPTIQGDLSVDMEVSSPPEDGISDLKFSPQAELLAVSSWDKKVRIYEITPTGSSIGKAVYEHAAPVLSVSWSKVCILEISCLECESDQYPPCLL